MAWNPKKTVSEIKKDPWRAARASATGGASEIPNVINANPSLKTGVIGEIMAGGAEKKLATPKLNIEDVLKPQNIENPYAEAAKQAMQQNVLPDFAQAQATAGQQGAFAKALQDLYGAGAGQMTGLMSNLQRQMSGDFGPGGALAQKVLEQGLSQNVAGVRSQLASQRGLNPALAARYAAQQTAQLGGQTAQQAGILGLQQQLAAQQQLGQLAGTSATLGAKAGDIFGQMRGQDITQAQATSDAALKRLGTLVQSDVGMRQIQAQTGMAENEIRQKVASANQAAAAGDRQLAAQIIGSLIGAGGQIGAAKATGSTAAPAAAGAGGAGAAAASDERTKKNIKNISDKDINEFLNSVNPVSYEYKEPEKYGQGDKAGFLMQDVADTKIGQMIQRPLPDGKMGYDPQSLQGVILAALARRNKAEGGRIDGTAPYAGDTPKNDIVPANLSPGEIVIPRSAAGSKKDAKSFIEALDDWDESEGYSKVLKARQKKNYFDGGVVDQDKELLAKSNREYFQQMNQEIPAIKSFKERLDEGLGKHVVDPMARAGYPTLGAALATVPSTAAEFLLPGSPAEMAGPLIPFPGAKLGRAASKQIKEAKAADLLEKMSADDVDIAKLPSLPEFKKFSKEYSAAKNKQKTQSMIDLGIKLHQENYKKTKELHSKIFGESASPSIWDLEALAYENVDKPDIKKALERMEMMDEKAVGMGTRKYGIGVEQAKNELYKALEKNKKDLNFSDELQRTKVLRSFPFFIRED